MNIRRLLPGLLFLAACSETSQNLAAPQYSATSSLFAVTASADTLLPGDTARLTAIMNKKPVGAAALGWRSSDPSVASVENGLIRAISDGDVVITASLGANEAQARLTVRTPLGVIIMIGDGMGTGAIAAAHLYRNVLNMEQLPVRGWQETACFDCGPSMPHHETESATAATTLATGVRTRYGYLGIAPNGDTLQNVLELAESKGMSTGLVTTSSVTHATPAGFSAHITDRSKQAKIAEQQSYKNIDVILAGGSQWFTPEMRARMDANGQLIRLFYPDSMPRLRLEDTPRIPSLSQNASDALDVLMKNRKGFFLMIEGSMIDWAGHNNMNQWLVNETLDFDDAVGAVIRKLGSRANTLLIVTADHETGGLTVTNGAFHWTTIGHTAANVPVFARGVGADALGTTVRNDQIGRLMMELVRSN